MHSMEKDGKTWDYDWFKGRWIERKDKTMEPVGIVTKYPKPAVALEKVDVAVKNQYDLSGAKPASWGLRFIREGVQVYSNDGVRVAVPWAQVDEYRKAVGG